MHKTQNHTKHQNHTHNRSILFCTILDKSNNANKVFLPPAEEIQPGRSIYNIIRCYINMELKFSMPFNGFPSIWDIAFHKWHIPNNF